jgi:integral membrane sensor domain MASE1
METIFAATIVGALATWVAGAIFGILHLNRFGPYWRPNNPASARLMRNVLLSGATFAVLILIAFLLHRRLYGAA